MTDQILALVTATTGVTVDEMRSRTNRKAAAAARQTYYVLMRSQTALSYPAIARTLNQTHTAALKSVQRANKAKVRK